PKKCSAQRRPARVDIRNQELIDTHNEIQCNVGVERRVSSFGRIADLIPIDEDIALIVNVGGTAYRNVCRALGQREIYLEEAVLVAGGMLITSAPAGAPGGTDVKVP